MEVFGSDVRKQRDLAWQDNTELRHQVAVLERAAADLAHENERLRLRIAALEQNCSAAPGNARLDAASRHNAE